MYEQKFAQTSRLTMSYYRSGESNPRKLLLIHGNSSSSVFYLPLFPELEKNFDVVAVDLRCFGDSDALPIDATRGYGDWCDDVNSFVEAIGWDSFALAGWSMGGGVSMQYATEHANKLTALILIAPASPFGLGGTKGETGELLQPVGLASGAGCCVPELVQAIVDGDREYFRTALNGLYFNPPFRMEPDWEERLLDAILKIKVGEGMFPGDSRTVEAWPGVAGGDRGVCNTMSAAYCQLSGLSNIDPKLPILWIHGDKDAIVSDASLVEFGSLGQIGTIPGWPGADVIPPQPMVTQTRYVLDRYSKNGGQYQEIVLPGAGHTCFLESPAEFVAAVTKFVN